MLGVTDLSTYLLGTVAIVLLPGPNTLVVLSTAARSGVRAGINAALGVFLGDWILMVATAAGVASLLRAYPPVFLAIKYAGAGYLAYIGLTMAVAAVRRWRQREPGEPTAAPAPPVRRPFRRAFAISLLNPKSILFFVSFFIQFVDPTYPHPAASFLLLALIFQILSALYLGGLILSGDRLAAQFRRRRKLTAGFTAGLGALFLAFGLRLATASLG